MKRLALLALIVSTLAATPAFAAKPKTPPVLHTATLTMWVAHHDASTSATVDGHTSTVGCNFDGANADCDDSTGRFIVKFDGGTVAALTDNAFIEPELIPAITHSQVHRPCVTLVPRPQECDPIASLKKDLLHRIGTEKSPTATFQFHWVTPGKYVLMSDQTPLLCIDLIIPDNHGKPTLQTAYYMVHRVGKDDPAYDALNR